MAEPRVVRSELILGAGAGGRGARARALASAWLAAAPHHRAVCIDTAQPWDEEMRELVEHCRHAPAGAARQLPSLREPVELAHALGMQGRADTLIVVDCLSFWLTASLMHALLASDLPTHHPGPARSRALRMIDAVNACAGPLVLVGNRIDESDLTHPRDTRRLLETLGALQQQAVVACERVTLMSAGVPLTLKDMS